MSVYAITGALLPVFALVLLGYFLKRNTFPEDSFWPQADRLTYFILFPALIVDKISTAQLSQLTLLPVMLILMGVIVLISAKSLIFSALFKFQSPVLTSALQGSIRPNTYVGLAGAASIFGAEGLALTAVAIAGVIPLVNIISVMAFVHYIPQGRRGVKAVFLNLFKNPLIVACIIGIGLNLSQLILPELFTEMLKMLGRAALPLGLISVGASLMIQSMKNWLVLLQSSLLKLFILPLLVLLACVYFEIGGLPRNIAVLYASLPCSVSSYTLAAQMGGDKNLVAAIITVQTLIAIVSIPLILSLTI